MRLSVIGTGYVGLVAGAGFADFGNDVVCIDIDHSRIERLRRGEIPIHEPGLPELVAANVAAGRLRFSTEYADATQDADVILLCVGTPPDAEGRADLSQVYAAAEAVGRRVTRHRPRRDVQVRGVGRAHEAGLAHQHRGPGPAERVDRAHQHEGQLGVERPVLVGQVRTNRAPPHVEHSRLNAQPRLHGLLARVKWVSACGAGYGNVHVQCSMGLVAFAEARRIRPPGRRPCA